MVMYITYYGGYLNDVNISYVIICSQSESEEPGDLDIEICGGFFFLDLSHFQLEHQPPLLLLGKRAFKLVHNASISPHCYGPEI